MQSDTENLFTFVLTWLYSYGEITVLHRWLQTLDPNKYNNIMSCITLIFKVIDEA
jgi:hypothetical protein